MRTTFTEQTAHGAAEFAARAASIIPGFESCTARILTDGSVVLMVGIQSHGQGLETALAQVAAEELGIVEHWPIPVTSVLRRRHACFRNAMVLNFDRSGWGGRIRTSVWRNQNPLIGNPIPISYMVKSIAYRCSVLRFVAISSPAAPAAAASRPDHPFPTETGGHTCRMSSELSSAPSAPAPVLA